MITQLKQSSGHSLTESLYPEETSLSGNGSMLLLNSQRIGCKAPGKKGINIRLKCFVQHSHHMKIE